MYNKKKKVLRCESNFSDDPRLNHCTELKKISKQKKESRTPKNEYVRYKGDWPPPPPLDRKLVTNQPFDQQEWSNSKVVAFPVLPEETLTSSTERSNTRDENTDDKVLGEVEGGGEKKKNVTRGN